MSVKLIGRRSKEPPMCLSISMYEYPGDKGAAAAASVAMEKKWSPPPRKRGNGGRGAPSKARWSKVRRRRGKVWYEKIGPRRSMLVITLSSIWEASDRVGRSVSVSVGSGR